LQGAVKAFAYPIALWTSGFGFGVFNGFYLQIEFILMIIRFATIFCASVGKYAQQRDIVLLKERATLYH
jgi:hypothetical protein